jgi:hypothetical protein
MKYLIENREFNQEDFEYYLFMASGLEIESNYKEISKEILGFTLNKLTPGHKIDLQNKRYEIYMKELLSGKTVIINSFSFRIEE